MDPRPLGRTGLHVTPIGFGAFKIGRNRGAKYPGQYALPDDETSARLLNAVLDMGVNYVDTAPAYGLSERRIGEALSGRRSEYVLSTKVGETFEESGSSYDFSGDAVRRSVERSLIELKTEVIDLVLIHSDGDDLGIMDQTDAVAALAELKDRGLVRAIGMSPKTPQGAAAALGWAEVVMVEHHLNCAANGSVIARAHELGVGVVVKKGLASGWLDPRRSVSHVLSNPGVTTMTIGTLNGEHMRENIATAEKVLAAATAG